MRYARPAALPLRHLPATLPTMARASLPWPRPPPRQSSAFSRRTGGPARTRHRLALKRARPLRVVSPTEGNCVKVRTSLCECRPSRPVAPRHPPLDGAHDGGSGRPRKRDHPHQVLSTSEHLGQEARPVQPAGYYRGYRRDCSGMVSMAWRLRTSYTSTTIRSRADSRLQAKPQARRRRPDTRPRRDLRRLDEQEEDAATASWKQSQWGKPAAASAQNLAPRLQGPADDAASRTIPRCWSPALPCPVAAASLPPATP